MRYFLIMLTTFLGNILSGYSQEKISYEQIAFKYYKDSIFSQYKLKGKITINKKPVDEYIYWNVGCLKEFNRKIGDTAFGMFSDRPTLDLNLENDNHFQFKKFKKNKLPMIFITSVLKYKPDQNIVAVVENLEGVLFTYLFDVSSDGKIKKWCKEKLTLE